MKRAISFLVLLGSVVATISAERIKFALPRPTMLLPEAYPLALGALGSDTNQFCCVQSLWSATPFEKWFFLFADTNGTSKGVSVFCDKKKIEIYNVGGTNASPRLETRPIAGPNK
jgi:hypothetical protein